MEAPRGTMIAYSTRPGDVAADGFGEYSPYTEALVAAMQIPGLSLSDLFIQARVAVMRATDDQQVPWEEGGLTARVYLNPSTEPATKAVLEEPEPKATAVSNDEKFEDLKQRCIDIGFEPGTETFGGCLLKLMD